MNMTPYLIAAAVICVAALIGTVAIGRNPEDTGYDDKKKSKKHFKVLTLMYVLGFIPAIIFTLLYFIFW